MTTDTAVVQDAGRDVARALAALREERAELAADVAGGDRAALARLEQLEAQIAAAEREQERAEVAAAVLERRRRDAAAVVAEAERARLGEESTALEAERDALIGRAVSAARVAAELAAEAIGLDRQLEQNRHALGASHRSIEGSMLVDRLSIEFRDRGMKGGFDVLGASWRATLISRWPAPPETKATVALCTVCAHAERDAIEAALAAGDMTLRAIEEHYGTSRSALSRHRQHHPST